MAWGAPIAFNPFDTEAAPPEEDAWLQGMQSNFARNKAGAKPGEYSTALSPEEEQQFGSWVSANKVPFNGRDPVQDYDMRGFWKGLQSGDPDAMTAVDPNDQRMHFPDKWKTPYHETFSADSQYATPDAPHWQDNRKLVDKDGKTLYDDIANNYDPFRQFASPNLPAPPQPSNGLLGNSFGILTPEQQKADLDARFADFNKQNAKVQQLERLFEQAKASGNPMAMQSAGRQLKLAQQELPDIDQLQLMEAGLRPLATKTPLRAAVENAPRAFAEGVLSVPEFAGIVKGYLGPGKVDDDNLLRWSQGAKDYVGQLFPGDAARQADFSQQLAAGLGTIATFYGAGAVTALAKAGPKATMAVLAGLGSTQTGSAGFEEGTRELQSARAKAAAVGDTATVTEYDRLLKTLGYTAVGATAAVPVARNLLGTTGRNVVQGALEQGAQMGGMQAAENVISKATTDPNRDLTAGVPEAVATGGTLGGLFNVLTRMARGSPVQPSGELDRGAVYEAAPDGTVRLTSPGTPMEPVTGRQGPGADNSPNGPAPKPSTPGGPGGAGSVAPEPPIRRPDWFYGPADTSKPKLRDDRGVPLQEPATSQMGTSAGMGEPPVNGAADPVRQSLRTEVEKQLKANPKLAEKAPELLTAFDTDPAAQAVIVRAAEAVQKTGKLSSVANTLVHSLDSARQGAGHFGEQVWGPAPTATSTRAQPDAGGPLAALGPRAAAPVAPPDRDPLGYYSKALEEAKALPMAKGTPEQMLAQLDKAGVKNNELVATNLDTLLLGPELAQQRRRLFAMRNEIAGLKTELADQRNPVAPERKAQIETEIAIKTNALSAADQAFVGAVRGIGDNGGPPLISPPKRSVTRDEIVQHLTQNRVGLKESRYGGTPDPRLRKLEQHRDAIEAKQREMDQRGGPTGLAARVPGAQERFRRDYERLHNERDQVQTEINSLSYKPPKWAKYSLDPQNPTYKETVLHLGPEPRQKEIDARIEEINREKEEIYSERNRTPGLASEHNARLDALAEEWNQLRAEEKAFEQKPYWTSGHWEEANIIAHMRTAEYQDTKGRKVTLLDELQSDEGQKVREHGVKSPERDAATRARIQELEARFLEQRDRDESPVGMVWRAAKQFDADNHMDYAERALSTGRLLDGKSIMHSSYYGFEEAAAQALTAHDPELARLVEEEKQLRQNLDETVRAIRDGGTPVLTDPRYLRLTELAHRYEKAVNERAEELMNNDPASLTMAEIETEKGKLTYDKSRPGHPLINTTDQWVETAMRRLIQQAADAGSDGIAITPGAVQNKRFSLSSVISRAEVTRTATHALDEGKRHIEFYAPGGMGVAGRAVVDPNGTVTEVGGRIPQDAIGQPLSAVVGVGPAKMLMEAKQGDSLNVEDMEVGGGGMKATYDAIYPRALGKLLKKLDPDIKPEKTRLEFQPFANGSRRRTKGTELDNDFTFFPLTEKAKNKLAEEGQPLFAIKGDLNEGRERAGNRGGRSQSGSLAPLKGAPSVEGATGPDPNIVAAAESYARNHGIDLRRQAVFAKVDEDLATRIAGAYDVMPHDPANPKVAEAYADMIQQTIAQYHALADHGFKFYFYDESNDPYQGNPWNAIRDLRENKRMAVFATEAGFGSGATDVYVGDGPMLVPSGLEWPYGSPNGPMKRVLVNDLFRAVHDAFGHSMEGAGFRARGEENAWQAHVRLYKGPAVGAVTTETRGQNSWLNFGPYGKANQTASVEDTVFGDQKAGLMPSWTWEEGRVPDEANDGDIVNSLKVGAQMLADWQKALRRHGKPDAAARAVETMIATDSRSPSAMQKALRAEGFGTVPNDLLDQGLLVTHMLAAGRPKASDLLAALKGFYSPAIRAAEKIKQPKATPQQWWEMISKTPGVRQEELHWMGLKQWLDEKGELMADRPGSNLPPSMKTLPREEIIDFMRSHQFELEEERLESQGSPEWQAEQQRIADEETARNMAEWERRRAGGLPEPEPEPEPTDEDDEDDPYDGMMSDEQRQEEIHERADEIYDELRDEAIDELRSEWYEKNDPRHFEVETHYTLSDANRKVWDDAMEAFTKAQEAWENGDQEQMGLPGIEAPEPKLADFLPDDFDPEEKPYYFRIEKPSGNDDGDYESDEHDEFFATEEEAQEAGEAWMRDYRDEFQEKAEAASESFYDNDFASEWGQANDQATDEWNNEHEDWVQEEDRGTPAQRRERERQEQLRERERRLRDLNRPPDPVQPRRWLDKTKFKTYSITGGSNYSELLVRLPELSEKHGYDSPHFHSDEVVHVRYDTREGPNGEKTLLIHEIQSDLHQRSRGFGFGEAGLAKAREVARDKGFTPETSAEYDRLRGLEEEIYRQAHALRTPGDMQDIKDMDAYNAKLQEAHEVNKQKQAISTKASQLANSAETYIKTFGVKGAPKAPYTGDAWWQLAFKAALQQAVENGYDAVALTTPKQISAASYTPAHVAQKFYGENLPRFIDKYLKQWGSAQRQEPLSGVSAKTQKFRPGTTAADVRAYFQRALTDGGLTEYGQDALRDFIADISTPSAQNATPEQLLDAVLNHGTAAELARGYYPRTAAGGFGSTFQNLLEDVTPPQPYWPITAKMRQDINDVGQPLASGAAQGDQLEAHIRASLKLGKAVTFPDSFVSGVHSAIDPATKALPTNVDAYVLASFEPGTQADHARAVFKTRAGQRLELEYRLDDFLQDRAFYLSANAGLPEGIFLLPLSGGRRLAQRLRGEVRHEAIHALWRRLPLPIRSRLVAHANLLNIMDLSLADYLEAIGLDKVEDLDRKLKLGAAYFNHYKYRTDRDELIEQESVTHMAELYSHGVLSDDDIGPVRHLLDMIFEGGFSDAEPDAAGSMASAFAGTGAMNADMEALDRAKELAKRGKGAWETWEETGWTKGLEGDWKFEIDDSGSRWKPNVTVDMINEAAAKQKRFKLEALLDHPKLFKSYPHLADLKVYFDEEVPFQNASYDTEARLIMLGIGAQPRPNQIVAAEGTPQMIGVGGPGDPETLGAFGAHPELLDYDMDLLRSTLLHEVQHAIQMDENFAMGASPKDEAADFQYRLMNEKLTERDRAVIHHLGLDTMLRRYQNAFELAAKDDDSDKEVREVYVQIAGKAAQELVGKIGVAHYLRSAGEIESRLVQRRMRYPEKGRRQQPPQFGDDYPRKQIGVTRGFELDPALPPEQLYTKYLKESQRSGKKAMSFRDFKKAISVESL